jgi:hypothetical protein
MLVSLSRLELSSRNLSPSVGFAFIYVLIVLVVLVEFIVPPITFLPCVA